MFTKESLERLKERIDLTELLSGYVDLKRFGASYKALCPFHEEKSPSFHLKKGDRHYHCFGCGAHGDAITFLMNHLRVPFREAVEILAEKFHVVLQEELRENSPEEGSLEEIKSALEHACEFYHLFLLQASEAKEALAYLFKRGFSLDFIKKFRIGYAGGGEAFFKKMREKGVSEKAMMQAGLLSQGGREFFKERITFPLYNPRGTLVGFSARKIREEVFGGKYINTPETRLFKKSKLLYGLNYCRAKIAKIRRAIVVEGQIDCLRMIDGGFDYTVAALGTAFGEGHVQELKQLGVVYVTLLFDGDTAGRAAVSKVGNLFQKVGMEAYVVSLPQGMDPDSFLQAKGKESLEKLLEEKQSYLFFQVKYVGESLPPTAAGKNALVAQIREQIRTWEEPIMVHESLKKLAALTELPLHMVEEGRAPVQPVLKKVAFSIDPDRIIELDLLRWLIFMERKDFEAVCKHHLHLEDFSDPSCRKIYEAYLGGAQDLLLLANEMEESLVKELLHKKINRERAEIQFVASVQKICDRSWLKKKEALRQKIAKEGDLLLIKEFDLLCKERPQVKLPT